MSAPEELLLPAPEGFRPAGRVLEAKFCTPPAIRRKRYTGRRLQGVRYEKLVHAHLESFYGEKYLPSPWVQFFAEGKWRWCQPDGLLLDLAAGRIIIVEVKYQHTPDAWWQVRKLYQPVLQAMFPQSLWAFEVCEVVRWYDPATLFPERVVLAAEVGMQHPAFKVHIWRP